MPLPGTQGLVVKGGHPTEPTWYANTVRIAEYGADFNSIKSAVAYCDAIGGEHTVLLYAHSYNEGDITPNGGANITLKGMGEDRVIIAPVAAPAAAVIVSAHTLTLEDVVVTAPTNAFPALRVTAGICKATRCELSGVAGGALHDAVQQVGGTLTLQNCTTPIGDIDLSTGACTLVIEGGDYESPFDMAGAFAHNIQIRHSDWGGNNWTLAGDGATFDFESNNDIGNITDASLASVSARISRCDVTGTFSKTGTTAWIADNCEIVSITRNNAAGDIEVYGGIVLNVTSSAGIIRLVDASYQLINRTGTGNIVDQSPKLGDIPWHVQKWDWQAALANSQVAVRGTPIDGGSGQVLLEIILNAGVGFREEAVEQLPEAGGANDNSVSPARTPRMITQFMWDRTGANQFHFIGLRETLGDVMPAGGGAEHCAGFCWDSVIGFFTRTDDGVDSQDVVFAAPGHGVQIQLEIIIFGGVRVEFYMDGVRVSTHTTRVPANTLDWQHLFYTDGGGGATDIDMEIRNGGVVECPA